jgi:hypothetical protein
LQYKAKLFGSLSAFVELNFRYKTILKIIH